MGDFLQKISSYHLFNYLFPGIIFVVLADKLTHFSFVQPDLVTALFVYYFVGMIISRFGSLVIEPIFKKLSLIKFGSYGDFVKASKDDPVIETLLEVANTYRTLCGVFIGIIFLKAYELFELMFTSVRYWSPYIVLIVLLIVFLLSYRKQSVYISKRIDSGK